jgi:quercetin dioxygenase-like cupin family protein
MWSYRLSLLVTLLVFAGCATTPTSLPGYIESHHHLLYQNGYVRVMETRLEPGQETLAHSHPLDAAIISLTDGQIRIRNDDGTIHDAALERNTVAFGANATVHRTGNIGEKTVRVIAVEIFSQPPTLQTATTFPSPGELLLENDRVLMSRIRLSPGDAIHLSGATPSVVVATNRGTLASGHSVRTLESGGAVWCDASERELRNAGHAAFEAIIVTLKPRIAE